MIGNRTINVTEGHSVVISYNGGPIARARCECGDAWSVTKLSTETLEQWQARAHDSANWHRDSLKKPVTKPD